MNKRKIGSRYEEAAAAFLQKQGFRILGKNFRCRQGEIDLVCREGKELVFTEVKYRSDAAVRLLRQWIFASRRKYGAQPCFICAATAIRKIRPAVLMWWE